MSRQDIRSALQKQPFEPFLLVMSDGRTYEVRHPELVMVGFTSLNLGIPPRDVPEPFYERFHVLALSHVTRLEPVDTASAT